MLLSDDSLLDDSVLKTSRQDVSHAILSHTNCLSGGSHGHPGVESSSGRKHGGAADHQAMTGAGRMHAAITGGRKLPSTVAIFPQHLGNLGRTTGRALDLALEHLLEVIHLLRRQAQWRGRVGGGSGGGGRARRGMMDAREVISRTIGVGGCQRWGPAHQVGRGGLWAVLVDICLLLLLLHPLHHVGFSGLGHIRQLSASQGWGPEVTSTRWVKHEHVALLTNLVSFFLT